MKQILTEDGLEDCFIDATTLRMEFRHLLSRSEEVLTESVMVKWCREKSDQSIIQHYQPITINLIFSGSQDNHYSDSESEEESKEDPDGPGDDLYLRSTSGYQFLCIYIVYECKGGPSSTIRYMLYSLLQKIEIYMAQKCPVCGEEAVVNDQDGDVKVCVECGSVVDDVVLTNDPSRVLDTLPYGPLGALASKVKASVSDRENRGKHQALIELSTIGKQNQLTDDMETAAKDMFDKMYEDEQIKHSLSNTKRHVVSACVYIVLRQYDYPITLKEFCIKNRLQLSSLATAYKLVLAKSNFELPNQSVATLAGSLLQQLGFDSSVISDALRVIDISHQAWLTTGQHRDSIIYVAGYFAYTVSKPEHFSLTFKDFCDKFKLVGHKKMYTKIKNVLQEFTNKLPWSQGRGKKNYVIMNLRDVFKYQRTLYNTVLHTEPAEAMNQDASCEGSVNLPEKELIEQKPVIDEFTSKAVNNTCGKRPHAMATGSNALLPPSFVRIKGVYKNKKRRMEDDQFCEEDGEWDGENLTEAQDRKLDEYIRDPKEIKLLEKISSLN